MCCCGGGGVVGWGVGEWVVSVGGLGVSFRVFESDGARLWGTFERFVSGLAHW